jgi:hypothetical protein
LAYEKLAEHRYGKRGGTSLTFAALSKNPTIWVKNLPKFNAQNVLGPALLHLNSTMHGDVAFVLHATSKLQFNKKFHT